MAVALIPVYLDDDQWAKLINNMSMPGTYDQEEIIIRTGQNFAFVCRKLIHKLYEKDDNLYGTIKLEMWKEGLVLWVGGIIKWKSFADTI